MPDLHPNLANYTDAPPLEEGVAGTPEQLLALILTSDPAFTLHILRGLLDASDRGVRCTMQDHDDRLNDLAARHAGAETRYRDLLATLVTVAATHPTTAAEALAEHTATTRPPSGAYKPNPVACDPTCPARLASHPEQGPHHAVTCLNYRNPRFRGPSADRVIVDDPPIGLADPDTECDCPDPFRATVAPNDHHASCCFTKHVLSDPNDPRSPDITRYRHPATGETVYTIPLLPKDTP